MDPDDGDDGAASDGAAEAEAVVASDESVSAIDRQALDDQYGDTLALVSSF
jgi:hypothetical protein